jgi:hypothetical protein
MLDFGLIAEKRIQEALEKGEFDDLPGAGRPLDLEYEPLVPPEVRVACRILKNAGIAPPEVVQRREMAELEAGRRDGTRRAAQPGAAEARLVAHRARHAPLIPRPPDIHQTVTTFEDGTRLSCC